jgi:hypothetical protein
MTSSIMASVRAACNIARDLDKLFTPEYQAIGDDDMQISVEGMLCRGLQKSAAQGYYDPGGRRKLKYLIIL